MRKREIGERERLISREEKITAAMVVASDGRMDLEVRPAVVCEREINFSWIGNVRDRERKRTEMRSD